MCFQPLFRGFLYFFCEINKILIIKRVRGVLVALLMEWVLMCGGRVFATVALGSVPPSGPLL